jgi:dihydroneopterin aldolase/2-amino-4-hydroxy-6-hydroxymethyldihydropteridine diphosphokinase
VNGTIQVRDLRLQVIVGVLPHERDNPQFISLDLDLVRDLDDATRRDDVAATTNYAEVIALVARSADRGFQLLETLARHVAEDVLASDEALSDVTVVVRKLDPPVIEMVGSVGVRYTVTRDA